MENMEPENDRNPSPPPELLERVQELLPDRIGESVFSKHWLFQILISIIEAVDKEAANDALKMESSDQAEASDVHELDSKLEEDACMLWDTSANSDVAHFLQEFKVADIFLEVIDKTKSPRLVEIAIGILGNLASFDDICQEISQNGSLLKMIVALAGSSDAPIIVQVLRLIHTGVVSEATSDIWLNILRSDSTFMKNIRFILENSVKAEVLKGALQLLYYVFDKEESVCVEWADKDYAKSIIDAGKELLGSGDFQATDELWLLLNLMCQHDENITALVSYLEGLCPLYHAYVTKFCEYDESYLPPAERVAAVAACFTTLATLLRKENVSSEAFSKDDTFVRVLKNMYCSVTEVLQKGVVIRKDDDIVSMTTDTASEEPEEPSIPSLATCNGDSPFTACSKLVHSTSLEEDDFNSLFILKETMTELCSIVLPSVVPKEESSR